MNEATAANIFILVIGLFIIYMPLQMMIRGKNPETFGTFLAFFVLYAPALLIVPPIVADYHQVELTLLYLLNLLFFLVLLIVFHLVRTFEK